VWAGHGPTATFIAPGNDWYTGTVARYKVTFAGSGTTISVAPTGAAGSTQSIVVPPGTTGITVQAVDAANNLGPPRTVT
jgi:hypothetical protein